MPPTHTHLVAPQEAALLRQIGHPLPTEMRLLMGTPTARFIGRVMTWLDAPPVAVTIGRTVYIPDPTYFRRLSIEERAALLAHEAVHVRQWQQMGKPRFLLTYLREYLRTRWAGIDTHDPQEGISLEREAIAVEQQLLTTARMTARGALKCCR